MEKKREGKSRGKKSKKEREGSEGKGKKVRMRG